MKIIGPFSQIVTMRSLPKCGPLKDDSLEILTDAGILVDHGMIVVIDRYDKLEGDEKIEVESPAVAVPGFVDAHTHLCWGGTRARDYALRVQGVTYQEIAASGGGILDTVKQTRLASQQELASRTRRHLDQQLQWGVTTSEVKSGYGLSVEEELKMLAAIQEASKEHPVDIVSTCLAAHTCPPEYRSPKAYLEDMKRFLFPQLMPEVKRIDIFIEKGAFSPEDALPYLLKAKAAGFKITVHANQFTSGGAKVAAEVKAVSADHLEHVSEEECRWLADAGVTAVALPGASLGLGVGMSPVRKMLDMGLSVAIASDWNPGSAPMGNLLLQASLLGASEKLSLAETLAGITDRAAGALTLSDRGVLEKGRLCNLTIFPTDDWREIFYYQGSLQPSSTIIRGNQYYHVDR